MSPSPGAWLRCASILEIGFHIFNKHTKELKALFEIFPAYHDGISWPAPTHYLSSDCVISEKDCFISCLFDLWPYLVPCPACVTFLKLAHFYPINLIGALSMKWSNETVISCDEGVPDR